MLCDSCDTCCRHELPDAPFGVAGVRCGSGREQGSHVKKNRESFETAKRYIAMLGYIPRRPHKITTSELEAKLTAAGLPIDVRSIQRDLNKLSAHFPLVSDAARPAGWSWLEEGPRQSFPHMDLSTALTFELLSRYLSPILPRKLQAQLQPNFDEARHVLDQMSALPLGKWSRQIAVVPAWQQLLPPEVDGKVIDVVYEALLAGRRFEANYLSLDSDKVKRYVFSPQGLVHRQGVMYLVASLFDYDNPMQFALHRMKGAMLLEDPAHRLKGFDLERYIREEHAFEIPTGDTIQLELRLAPWLARHLGESRLSRNQVIAPIRGSDRFRLVATVPDTAQLHWWLRGFGPDVEVLKPAALRRKMKADATELTSMYRRSS